MAFFTTPDQILNLHPALLFVIIVWTIIWKGLAMWKAAHKEQPIWFVVLLALNTIGILDILYIYLFSEMKPKGKKGKKGKAPKAIKLSKIEPITKKTVKRRKK